jgi:dipeptidyl-peptidase 4
VSRHFIRSAPLLLTICVVCLALATSTQGQGTRTDYERAESLRQRSSNRVFRSRVEPHWIAGGDHFWYRVEVARDRHRFILVDAHEPSRREAFDHEKLAASLSQQSGMQVEADRLPFDRIELDDDRSLVRFSAFAKKWQYAPKENLLSEAPTAIASSNGTTAEVLPAPQVGGRQGEESRLVFRNETEGNIKLFWINDLSSPTFYEEIAPGEEHDQHTYGGHTWLVRDQAGKPLGAFRAGDQPTLAVIDGSWRLTSRHSLTGRGGRSADRRLQGRRSPNERFEAKIVDHNVVLLDRDIGEEIRLSSSGTAVDPFLARFAWSPDSTKLVVIQERPAEPREVHLIESSPRDQLQPKLHGHRYAKPGDRIAHPRPRLFDIDQQKQIDVEESLFADPWSLQDIRWDDDSSRFTFLYNQRGHQTLRLVAVDADSGAARAIIDETSDTFICYSGKFFLEILSATNELVWMSERDGWNHLYLYDSRTGEVKNQITRGEWVVREVDRVDSDRRQIWFRAGGIHPEQDPYYVHYCRVNFDGSGLTILTEGDGTHSLDYSPDRQYFVDTYSRVDMPPVTELRRTDEGALVCELEQADWSELIAAGWQVPERFVAKGRAGQADIYGVIYRPTSFDPPQKYPVIEQIYAGPQSAYVPKRFSYFHGPQALAELGFVVVQIDGQGTSHRSKAFHDVCYQNLGDAGFPDRIAWLRAAAAERPFMDLRHVGIYGGSAGGQNAMRALIAHGDFYHAAVADCGCHDNRMDKIWWNEQWMGYPVGEHYQASSNVEQAHRMQGKLLLTVGELDRNVDPASTMQVVDALIRADKDFELIVFPGAGHGAGGSRYGVRRMRDFFVRHLLGTEPRGE